MRFKHKIIIFAVLLALSAVFICAVSSAYGSDDPADNYVVQTAPNEDSSINMWFDYSFRKTLTSDNTSTGMNTFSIYMAKNEIEDAQFVLFSTTTHTGMSASLSAFADENGNTVDAEIYYEMYVTVGNDIDTTNVLGWTQSKSIIRKGETPDPIAPLANIGTFKLNAGKSQSFLIRAKTTTDSVSGWYSAQLDIKDSSGNIVKTATVYLYVWNFEIPEENSLQTAFFINNTTDYGGSYQNFYDYLLENRLCGMDIPGTISPTNSYITNPRVSAVRITSGGGGASGYYADQQVSSVYGTLYKTLREDDEFWEATKDKYYFYSADEPVAALYWTGWTIDKTNSIGAGTEWFWPEAQLVVPHHENTPYPDKYYTNPLSNYQDYQLKDANQELIDKGGCTVWCPMIYGFSKNAELSYYGDGRIRDMSGWISGIYYTDTTYNNFYYGTYDWEAMYGDFYDRIMSEIYLKNQAGYDNYKMWAYGCGTNTSYTYCNHLIENTGIQTKLLFWQMYQNDSTGYLYYGTNNWTEYTNNYDNTVTGAKTTCTWMTNASGNSYGNGVLFYGMSQGKIKGLKVVGSLRVELLRDGEEEYEMLKMLEEYKGEKVAKSVVGLISQTVNNYISLPKYNRNKWDSSMDDYDVVEYVRRSLGNQVESAVMEGECDHTWDEGVVSRKASCIKAGETTYTCVKCSAQRTEIIPTLHSVGDCFILSTGMAPTCETGRTNIYQCTICGFRKTVTEKSHHSDTDYHVYSSKNTTMHNYYCSECDTLLGVEGHMMLTVNKKATCTEEGSSKTYCRICDYVESEEITPSTGHSYVDGVCEYCGNLVPVEPEPEYDLGDANKDGKRNNQDVYVLKQMITGNVETDDETLSICDISGDGKVSALDINYLIKIITGVYNG